MKPDRPQPTIVSTCLFVTEGEIEQPTLITIGNLPGPPHPAGKSWKLLVRIYDHPRKVIIGRKLVKRLMVDGYVIDERAVEALLKLRPSTKAPASVRETGADGGRTRRRGVRDRP